MHNKSIYVGIDDFAYKKGKDYMSAVSYTHLLLLVGRLKEGNA